MTGPATAGASVPAATSERAERPLRVAIGLEGLALGGNPINALDLGRALRRRGHQVDVFAVSEDVRVSLLPYAERCGFSVTLLPRRTGVWALASQIRRFARAHRSDIVHVYGPWMGPPAAVAVSVLPDTCAVMTNWNMENVFYTPRLLPVIVGTTAMHAEAEAHHHGPVWLMEPPVDLEADRPDPEAAAAFRAEHGLAEDEVAAVIVSRLDSIMKAEGIQHAIDAVALVDDPALRLVVVGDGDAFDRIRRRAEAVNEALGRPAVLLTGNLVDPHPAYAAADLVLGMGGSAIRALAHGKPLVGLGVNGFAKPFAEDTTDYFYTDGFYGDGLPAGLDPVEHLASLVRPLLDADRRAALGRFGLAEVTRRFGLDSAAQALERIYERSLREAPPVRQRVAIALGVLARRGVRTVVDRTRRPAARR